MVITDKFVYIHLPKTGGSFVVAALWKLYGRADISFGLWPMLKLIFFIPVQFPSELGPLTFAAYKHSGCKRIPAAHRGKAILSNMRHPLDYYVSQYEFGWWKRPFYRLYYYRRIPGFRRKYPHFPDLSFTEFLEVWTTAINHRTHTDFYDPAAVGYFTNIFINCFFKDPKRVLSQWNTAYLESGAYQKDMYPIDFLHTHDLNRQLYDYLQRQGYPPERLTFITDMDRVLPGGKGRTKEQKWQKYYSPELIELILQKDRLLFELFPMYREKV